MLQNASYMFFLKRNKTNENDYENKKKSITWQESNPRPSTSNGNALSIAPCNHCRTWTIAKLIVFILHSKYFPDSDWLKAHV